jgi:DNA-binding GntR family transcriptional regulator
MKRPSPEKTYNESVYERLRKEILSGELKPGDRLTEQDIARRMGTSQGPVREALARLRPQGLIVTLPHRGSFVTEISAEQASQIYSVRILLEKHATALALPRMTDADIADLRNLVAEMVAFAGDGDFFGSVARDMAFHRRLFELSGSEILLQFWDIIEAQTTKFVAAVSRQVFDDMVKIAGTHFTLTSAMEARDLPRLHREIEEHLLRIWRGIDNNESISVA